MPMKPLLCLVAGLVLTACATSNSDAGCVTYRRYAPTASIKDTDATIEQITTLDVAMEAACK